MPDELGLLARRIDGNRMRELLIDFADLARPAEVQAGLGLNYLQRESASPVAKDVLGDSAEISRTMVGANGAWRAGQGLAA